MINKMENQNKNKQINIKFILMIRKYVVTV